MERGTSMLSAIRIFLDTLSSGARSILGNGSAPTTPALRTETFPCTMCGSSPTCDGRNEYCMSNCVDTTSQVSGTISTPKTPASSSSLYQIIEDGMVEIAEEDTQSWEQSLRAKYGIANPMEKA